MEDTITWAWLIAGIVLLVTELFLPGLVVSFLGLAAILVACFRWLGFLSGWIDSFGAWFITSIVLLMGVRTLVLRWFPGESSYQATDEDLEAIGSVVEVVDTIEGRDQEGGRIRYMGTSWPAKTKGEFPIPAGKKAKLLYRENLIWVVEPYVELEIDSSKEIE